MVLKLSQEVRHTGKSHFPPILLPRLVKPHACNFLSDNGEACTYSTDRSLSIENFGKGRAFTRCFECDVDYCPVHTQQDVLGLMPCTDREPFSAVPCHQCQGPMQWVRFNPGAESGRRCDFDDCGKTATFVPGAPFRRCRRCDVDYCPCHAEGEAPPPPVAAVLKNINEVLEKLAARDGPSPRSSPAGAGAAGAGGATRRRVGEASSSPYAEYSAKSIAWEDAQREVGRIQRGGCTARGRPNTAPRASRGRMHSER